MIYVLDLFIAMVIDWIIGDPYGFPHPVIYIGKLISKLHKLSKRKFKTPRALKICGGIIVIIVSFTSFIIPFFILYITKNIPVLHHIINIIILWTTLAPKCLGTEGKKIYIELVKDNIEEARVKLSYIVGRETANLTEKEVISADVETIAENTADGVIAPMFFAMIFGPFAGAGAMLYKGINTMDSMLGYMTAEFRDIGFFPAKVDDIFNYIPARISGALIAISAPLVGGDIINSFKIMIRDRKNHKSPNCAYSEGAAAGAMNIRLGGTHTYFGETIYKPTIGDNNIEIRKEHIIDSIKLMYGCQVLFFLTYTLVIFLWKVVF